MKPMKKTITTLSAVAVLGLLGLAGCQALEQAFAVKVEKITHVQTNAPLEKQYSQMGQYAVAVQKYPAANKAQDYFTVYYPQTGGNYPLIVLANGTGMKVSSYEAVLQHLASHGFVVIGSQEGTSWTGSGVAGSLDFALSLNQNKTSPLYQKINPAKIGVSGHSQGGVGAINAATTQANSRLIRSVYTASTTQHRLARDLGWDYDISKIKAPYFETSGTGVFDAGKPDETAGGIAPLSSLKNNFNKINGTAVMAQRKGEDHGSMLYVPNGYMAAWFLYTLNNDSQAKQVFVGQNAEISRNSNWQNVQSKNLR
ncbi:poly(ethylene terephthalate) hydrolase family protein [Testudinibacter sp. TR-2022]|uniref:poly(ethylene terephthalate) hydrolase family protein n=1 Tax=Testudinibacter sp. TR-2022 TaxID=2585029 RepID=UPI00111A5BC0|nr:alpha/beta hydrolase [Testudinibacter sp. TR-2022]TNH05045.1 alpha/beta hydrolase [Pasteurellaceae bacterium Phil11]TNH19515.1 alpha/beta hydrolase [Testudinibacter sp. TR-2022]TNH27577.1 alpha/beta hydrolase [Testudinibacter sp. TR-2022]